MSARRRCSPTDSPGTETGRECGDGQDNDGDGTADCADPDCATAPPCMSGGRGGRPTDSPGTETGRECGDGQDNDGDGTADCDDPDCATAPPCMAGGRGGPGGRGGGCNAMTMATSAATVTTTCCAGADCSTGVPTSCTAACAPVFLDFMDSCGTMISQIPGMTQQYASLQTQCHAVEQGEDGTGAPPPTTGATDCGMNTAVAIMMSCSDVRGDFCSSPCYTSLSPFVAQCQDQITPTLTMMLSSGISRMTACGNTPGGPGPGSGATGGGGSDVTSECTALFNDEGRAALTTACLPSGDLTTMPTKCSHACADVLVPLYNSCAVVLQDVVPGIDSFAALCQTTQDGH